MTAPEPFVLEPGRDPRRSAPHVARNADAIVEILRTVLPADGTVLEIASGTGEHAVRFARSFAGLIFQPSDPDPVALASIDAWRTKAGLPNLLAPLRIDASAPDWPIERAEALLCINMVHISPWSATQGLFREAGRILGPNAPLYLYGAYRRAGVATAPSNEAFHASLRARNPDWGLRLLEDVVEEGRRSSLALDRVAEMPANNLSVIFRKTAS